MVFLKAPFLILRFPHYKVMTFLKMLNVILPIYADDTTLFSKFN